MEDMRLNDIRCVKREAEKAIEATLRKVEACGVRVESVDFYRRDVLGSDYGEICLTTLDVRVVS